MKRKTMTHPEPETRRRIADLIRTHRRDSHLTRSEVCSAIGITNSQLSAWENGKAEPRMHAMISAAQQLNIPMEQILDAYGCAAASTLNEDEARIISEYRMLPAETRTSVLGMVQAVHNDRVRAETNSREPKATPEPAPEPTPRRRGRPRKNPVQEAIQEPALRRRGRPRKNPVPETAQVTAPRRRGRPRKNPVPETAQVTTPRRRDRPRKGS